MKIVAFGASTSSTSINKMLVTYAASLVPAAQTSILDLNDFAMPLFSQDSEQAIGQHPSAQDFYHTIGAADVLIISFAEHNGSYTAAYKNIFDWTSRIDMKVFQNKPAIYLSTSPGPGGAKNVLGSALASATHFGADVIGSMSVPSFYDNFDMDKQVISNSVINENLKKLLLMVTS